MQDFGLIDLSGDCGFVYIMPLIFFGRICCSAFCQHLSGLLI
jgi:hypothetical protein